MFSKFNVSKKGELCHRTTLHCGLLKSLEVVDTDTQSINQQVCPRERLLALIYVEFFHMRWRAMNIQPSGLISTPPNTARHRQIPPRAAAHLQYRPGAPIASWLCEAAGFEPIIKEDGDSWKATVYNQ